MIKIDHAACPDVSGISAGGALGQSSHARRHLAMASADEGR